MTDTRGSQMWGVGSVALAVSLIGTIGTAHELGPESLSALATGSWRGVIGAAGLVTLAAVRGQAPWRYRLPARWVVFGALGMAVSQFGFFEATSRTGVAVGTLVVIGVGPAAAGVIDWLAYRARPSRRWMLGAVLALGGVALLTGGGDEVVWSGVAFGVAAGCGIPCQGFAAQQLMVDRPLLPSMAAVVAAGAVLLVPTAAATAGSAFDSAASASTVMYLGLVTITLAHSLWAAGLKRLSLSMAVVVGLLEPAVASALATGVLGEPVTAALVAGICLVIAGIAVTSLPAAGRHR
ncbi:MAG: EamA family transporter [Acidimicrobiaceae bacterium]|nr:EamA family transporter [Acidimicrobiaceae bacterium]MXZ53591.1 EamA family transporter [Acidimicrobiaceae bacterium]MYB87602.1 EamA family transporter [Acidimicrobiaceae bacterium]MYH94757.1 EamA family transporter [Acidimicrobiaceae bacterium]